MRKSKVNLQIQHRNDTETVCQKNYIPKQKNVGQIKIIYNMFRHLSPKPAPKIKPQIIVKTKSPQCMPKTTGIPISHPKTEHKFPEQRTTLKKQKDIKNLNSFFNSNKQAHKVPPNPIIPNHVAPVSINFNSSSEQNKLIQFKTGSVFDDYYERQPKEQQKHKKQEVSNSGDSYQSEGCTTLKRPIQKNRVQNNSIKQKNLAAVPLLNNQDFRNGFKSPGNRPAPRSDSENDMSLKRILSFGGKKGRFLEDGDQKVKQNNQQKKSENKTPFSPQIKPKPTGFPPSNLNHQNKRKQFTKTNTSNDEKIEKVPRNVPKFIGSNGIKSSPYLNKFALDSSNEKSGQKAKLKHQKPKAQPLLGQLKREREQESKNKEDDKSLSFNKGQMFSTLKQRQERHSLLCKEINILGLKVELQGFTPQADFSLELTLVKKINQSKNTAIFLAYHHKTSSLYCLKRVPLQQLKKIGLSEAIREHKLLQICSHPHIVRCFSSAHDSQYLYLLMEYMQGGTLGQQLREHVLRNMSETGTTKAKINESITAQISKINKIRRIIFEIASAISYLNERNIIHRDIKPDNIFSSYDTYKIGDFGSANLQGSLEYVGTLDYAAPEILSQSVYDEKVDIWSLGCIAYELDVGRPPFFHINQDETKRLAINGEYDKSLICDNQLRGVIERMLVPNRKNRLSAKELLKHDFVQGLQDGSAFF